MSGLLPASTRDRRPERDTVLLTPPGHQHPRPGPAAAYCQWIAECATAGWQSEPLSESVPAGDALHRVLLDPVQARWPSPRADCAAMDGIAFRAADARTLPGAAAGELVLAAGAFHWADTGDPLPAGTDTLAKRERVRIAADGSALLAGPVPRGHNVRVRGEDFPVGPLPVQVGRPLRPADLAAIAASGNTVLTVARRPSVTIIPTGDEIRPAGVPLGPSDIVDSNSVMLAARTAQIGARPRTAAVQPDDRDKITAAVRSAAAAADLVLLLSGSSAGRGDFARDVLAQAGGLTVAGVAVRPGHPALLGYARTATGAVPVIGVPGYPMAAAVIFELFAVPLLTALLGRAGQERPTVRAVLDGDRGPAADVEEWVPVTLLPPVAADGRLPRAVPCAGHGAGAVSRMVRADAWWPITAGQGGFSRGDVIDVIPLQSEHVN